MLAAATSMAMADPRAEVNALLSKGDAAGALLRADAALATDSRDVQLRFLRGVVLMDLKRQDEALAVFMQMSRDFPELPDPFNNIALLQVQAGKLDEARLSLESALRNDPAHTSALANLGQVHLMLAARSWEQLSAQGPTDTRQQERLKTVRSLLQR